MGSIAARPTRRFRIALLLSACLLSLSPASSGSAPERDPALSPERRDAIHVLNRLGFGARPGDLERVEAMGIERYIEQQLHPERLPDSRLESRLGNFQTLQMSTADLAVKSRQDREERRQRQRDRQTPADEEPAGAEMEAPERPMMERPSAGSSDMPVERRLYFEMVHNRLLRAVHSERQLQEVMVDFWLNHFNVFMGKGLDRILVRDFEEQAIRPHLFGRFEDLLMATAQSPAMLFYLDNWISSAPAEVVQDRVRSQIAQQRGRRGRRADSGDRRQWAQARMFLNRAKGLNENYARELMELHTLGVDGGYTQEDVIQVAKCLTGWTMHAPEQGSGFRFEPIIHEGGDKLVLGQRIRESGVQEGEQVIRLLARHPSTARFISSKLIRRFVADEPPADLLDRTSQTFLKSGGNIRAVLTTIFGSPEFLSAENHQNKVRKPFELMAASLRALGADFGPHPLLVRALNEMGEPLYMCQPPTGYPDTASDWINTNSLLKRLNFAIGLAASGNRGIRFDPGQALAHLTALGLTLPDDNQLEQTRRLLEEQSSGRTRGGGWGRDQQTVLATAFMLGSPQFQKR